MSLSNLLKRTVLLASFLALLALGACSTSIDSAADRLRLAVAASKGLTDPLSAVSRLNDALSAFQETSTDCSIISFECPRVMPVVNAAVAERNERLKQAIDKLPSAQITQYYTDPSAQPLREVLAPRLLALAEKSQGGEKDAVLLRSAGEIVRDGTFVVRSTDLAAQYFARAWRAGDTKAAAANALLYESVHDTNNAYLWALRCKGECQSDTAHLSAGYLRERLTTAAIRQAEQAAADTTVLSLVGR